MRYTVEKAPMKSPDEVNYVGDVDSVSPIDALRQFSDEPVRIDLGDAIEAGCGEWNWTVKPIPLPG